MTNQIIYEDPCDHDGTSCDWVCEDRYDVNGDLEAWDLYCDKCYRYRDWSREELPVKLASHLI